MTRSLRKLSFTISLLALFSPKVPFADPLHDAAGDGDVAAVKRLLALGHAINARDENEATPLHWAAYGGHAEVVRLLIARGADVYANETQRWATALQQAP
ncbi:MAG: hypothetical protein GTN85_03450, partial [Pseudomonas stutzeri]|nr:hypothetical protein [Stutzerimonas stutzeri]